MRPPRSKFQRHCVRRPPSCSSHWSTVSTMLSSPSQKLTASPGRSVSTVGSRAAGAAACGSSGCSERQYVSARWPSGDERARWNHAKPAIPRATSTRMTMSPSTAFLPPPARAPPDERELLLPPLLLPAPGRLVTPPPGAAGAAGALRPEPLRPLSLAALPAPGLTPSVLFVAAPPAPAPPLCPLVAPLPLLLAALPAPVPPLWPLVAPLSLFVAAVPPPVPAFWPLTAFGAGCTLR